MIVLIPRKDACPQEGLAYECPCSSYVLTSSDQAFIKNEPQEVLDELLASEIIKERSEHEPTCSFTGNETSQERVALLQAGKIRPCLGGYFVCSDCGVQTPRWNSNQSLLVNLDGHRADIRGFLCDVCYKVRYDGRQTAWIVTKKAREEAKRPSSEQGKAVQKNISDLFGAVPYDKKRLRRETEEQKRKKKEQAEGQAG